MTIFFFQHEAPLSSPGIPCQQDKVEGDLTNRLESVYCHSRRLSRSARSCIEVCCARPLAPSRPRRLPQLFLRHHTSAPRFARTTKLSVAPFALFIVESAPTNMPGSRRPKMKFKAVLRPASDTCLPLEYILLPLPPYAHPDWNILFLVTFALFVFPV